MKKKRNITVGIALLLLFAGSTSANIVVRPISFTASENLLIDLDEEDAHISGVFEFDIKNRERLMNQSKVYIPVWLSAHAQPDQKNLRTFLETISFQGKKQIPLNWKSRAVLGEIIELQVEANRRNYFLGEKPLGFELMVINPAKVVFRCPERKVIVRELR